MMMLGWMLNPLLLIALIVFAVLTLSRTRDPSKALSPADRRWRIAALGVMLFFVLGFGLCGAFGTVAGLVSLLDQTSGEARAYGVIFLLPGLVGLALAAVGVFLLRKHRRAKAAPQDSAP
jgi:uncharacterized oligopeptide transporter (OPT) family protein